MIHPGETIGPSDYHHAYLGVVLDLDGTLVNSRHDFHAMRMAIVDLAERSGVPPGELHTTTPIPRLMRYSLDRMGQLGLPEGHRLRFEAEANKLLDELEMRALPGSTLMPDVLPFLASLHRQGYRMGVLTRSSGAFTRTVLHQLGILPYFKVLRTRQDAGPVKPDPEALLLLLKDLGVAPDRAVYIGDHVLDLECAVGARVRFFALLHPTGEGTPEIEAELRRKGATDIARGFPEIHARITGGVPWPSAPVTAGTPPRRG